MNEIVKFLDVNVSYNNKTALRDVSLSIYDDDFVGFIGPNGGGKTTLVKALLGLVDYTGKILIDSSINVKEGGIGYLPQINDFDKRFPIDVNELILSGLQNGKSFKNRYSKSDKLKADEIMDMVNIKLLSGKSIGEISGGELQRALLCRAVISKPKLLILDEPANFVDNIFEIELYEILKRLNNNMAIIMVSHDLGTIATVVKSIVCINKTAHRHDSSEITPEIMDHYNCPIQLLTHGEIPHTVLKNHC